MRVGSDFEQAQVLRRTHTSIGNQAGDDGVMFLADGRESRVHGQGMPREFPQKGRELRIEAARVVRLSDERVATVGPLRTPRPPVAQPSECCARGLQHVAATADLAEVALP